MHKTVLREVIRRADVATQFAKKISHMGLVSTHQLTESRSVL
jgi:hypothetical protein